MSDKKDGESPKRPMIKNYQIVSVIGKGGMGEVYLAKHPTLKREIILKRLKIKDKESSERFLQEAKVMLDFRHENIVQFYDHFKEGGSTYIAMEYVKGKALNKIIEENEIIPIPLALFIVYQLALGLNHAHSKKVIHRDIKPHNILISKDGDVKLTDFGIAMRTSEDSGITKTGSIIGTPAYMAPEQFSSKKEVTYQSDIYSLGVVFYEMITGVRPFKNEYTSETINAITKGKYISPSKYVKNLPSIVYKIIAKTFNPKVSSRYKTLIPLIKLLRSYFRKFNIFEIKDSIKRLVCADKNLLKSPFFIDYKRIKAFSFYKKVVLIFLLLSISISYLFFYSNSYYEFFFPDKYGKLILKFNKANMNKDNIFIGIDHIYEKAIFNFGENFSKSYYLTEGEHEFSIISGSYKNTKKYYVNSISTLKANNSKVQTLVFPITKLWPQEVVVYFRFWDALKNERLLFKFDSFSDNEIEKYKYEDESLKILAVNGFVSLKDYIYQIKTGNKKNVPFYSSKKYAFRVENFKLGGVLYDTKNFDITFSLDDRTVVTHIPLNPLPATINLESNVNKLPIFINNNDSGLVFENGNYIYKKYNQIKFTKSSGKYTGFIKIPNGNYEIKTVKNGKSQNYKLTNGRVITIKINKNNGKYVIED